MDNKIIDIYNLDNLKTDCKYFTMRITILNDEIYSFEIDGETHNKNKINIIKNKTFSNILELSQIIKEYGYNETLIGIKFILHNIDTPVNYKSTIFTDDIYNGQIIYDNIINIFELNIGKKLPIINGYVQINIYKLKILLKISVNDYLILDYEYINPDKYFYNFKSSTFYFKVKYNNMNKFIKEYNNFNKLIKIDEISFTSNNKEGTLQIEMYKPCKNYYCCLITKINYNGYIIDMIQNIKCNCIEYELLEYIKTENKFYNRQKMCICFAKKKYLKLNEINIKYYKIDKNILINKFYMNNDKNEIQRYFYYYF
jgi:hypothetical protein